MTKERNRSLIWVTASSQFCFQLHIATSRMYRKRPLGLGWGIKAVVWTKLAELPVAHDCWAADPWVTRLGWQMSWVLCELPCLGWKLWRWWFILSSPSGGKTALLSTGGMLCRFYVVVKCCRCSIFHLCCGLYWVPVGLQVALENTILLWGICSDTFSNWNQANWGVHPRINCVEANKSVQWNLFLERAAKLVCPFEQQLHNFWFPNSVKRTAGWADWFEASLDIDKCISIQKSVLSWHLLKVNYFNTHWL